MGSQPIMQEIQAAGKTLKARYWPSASKRDVFVCLHGVESHSEWFARLAAELNKRDCSCLAFDRPGWGETGGQECIELADCVTTVKEGFRFVQDHERRHGVGLSWGGLLLAQLAMTAPDMAHSWHFVAPGWYPAGRWRMIKQWSRHIGQAELPLWIRPEDFSDDPEDQKWIASDPLRNTTVSRAFLRITLQMISRLRRDWPRAQLQRANLYLAAHDHVIRNAPTRKLFARAELDASFCREYREARHSLVLEQAPALARDMVAHVGGSFDRD